MPTGTSDGAKSTRPSRSAVSTRMLPVSAETQSSGPVRLPVSLRARCGTIRPTKPSRPAKLTTAAAEALAQIRHSIRTRPTRTPSERARSSPRHRSRILPEQASETENPSRMIAPGSHSRRMSVLDSPPAEK